MAGRAYQQVETLSHDEDGGRIRAWVPVLDGTERLGVLAVTVEDEEVLAPDSPPGRALRFLASLVGELVASKTMYGDAVVRLRRSAPMGLAAEIQWSLLPPLTFASRDVSIAGALERLHYLRFGLSAVLIFAGAKMLLSRWIHVPIGISLAVIASCIAVPVVLGLLDARGRLRK